MKKPLSKLLIDYRILHKLTQEKMAKWLDCTQAQLSLWENGKIPSKSREELLRSIIK